MLTIPPFTMIFIAPLNNQLLDEEACSEQTSEVVEEKLTMWNRRHAVRSFIAICSFSYMTWLISRGK